MEILRNRNNGTCILMQINEFVFKNISVSLRHTCFKLLLHPEPTWLYLQYIRFRACDMDSCLSVSCEAAFSSYFLCALWPFYELLNNPSKTQLHFIESERIFSRFLFVFIDVWAALKHPYNELNVFVCVLQVFEDILGWHGEFFWGWGWHGLKEKMSFEVKAKWLGMYSTCEC